jgi:DNA-binding Lrp family transcriptional regulator
MNSEFNNTSSTLDATDLKLLSALQADASISNIALANKLQISAPTCLRRTKRLVQEGWIEKQVAILSSDKLGQLMGHKVTALIEVSLDKQGEELLQAFENRAVQEAAVQQCWRVSPGPDFMLVVQVTDMPAYLAFTQRLLTQDANVRNVKAFFSVKRAKFGTEIPLPLSTS